MIEALSKDQKGVGFCQLVQEKRDGDAWVLKIKITNVVT